MSENIKYRTTLSVTPTEKKQIQELAKQHHRSVADYLKLSALNRITPEQLQAIQSQPDELDTYAKGKLEKHSKEGKI